MARLDKQQHVEWNAWSAWRKENNPMQWSELQTTADPKLRWLWIHNYAFHNRHHQQWWLFHDSDF